MIPLVDRSSARPAGRRRCKEQRCIGVGPDGARPLGEYRLIGRINAYKMHCVALASNHLRSPVDNLSYCCNCGAAVGRPSRSRCVDEAVRKCGFNFCARQKAAEGKRERARARRRARQGEDGTRGEQSTNETHREPPRGKSFDNATRALPPLHGKTRSSGGPVSPSCPRHRCHSCPVGRVQRQRGPDGGHDRAGDSAEVTFFGSNSFRNSLQLARVLRPPVDAQSHYGLDLRVSLDIPRRLGCRRGRSRLHGPRAPVATAANGRKALPAKSARANDALYLRSDHRIQYQRGCLPRGRPANDRPRSRQRAVGQSWQYKYGRRRWFGGKRWENSAQRRRGAKIAVKYEPWPRRQAAVRRPERQTSVQLTGNSAAYRLVDCDRRKNDAFTDDVQKSNSLQ
uniref:Uncharacterized protein n=1 Tax=Trichuris muris TaxID=70415 RepID=A0A5S6QBZ9_TRIMR